MTDPRPNTPIRVRLTTIDHYSESRTFRTLKGAQAYAARKLGTGFDISVGFNYAIDMYGVVKLTANIPMHELMNVAPPEPETDMDGTPYFPPA